jgi:hypothetical protein
LVDQSLRARPLDVHLTHRGQVLHAHIGAGVEVLFDRRGIGEREHKVAATLDQLAGGTQMKIVKWRSTFWHMKLLVKIVDSRR